MCIHNSTIESGLCFSALCQVIYICCSNELAQQFYQAGKIVRILYVRKQKWEKLKSYAPCRANRKWQKTELDLWVPDLKVGMIPTIVGLNWTNLCGRLDSNTIFNPGALLSKKSKFSQSKECSSIVTCIAADFDIHSRKSYILSITCSQLLIYLWLLFILNSGLTSITWHNKLQM